MLNNKIREYIQLAIAAARAAYGDFTGLAVQGAKYLPKIIAVFVAIIIIVVILPVMYIKSFFTFDSTTPEETNSAEIVESLQYQGDWVTLMAIAQMKKELTGSNKLVLSEANQVLKDNKINEYLQIGIEGTTDVMALYNRNLEFMKSKFSSSKEGF